MLTPPVAGSNSALGFFITDKDGTKYFSHGGANVGFRGIFFGSFESGDGVVVFVNSDNGQIINEIVNSVARVYNWKNFITTDKRKLVALPDSVLNKYVGEYQSEEPKVKIQIARRGQHLEAAAYGTFERMYFVGERKFFLMSSPNIYAEFQLDANGSPTNVIVKDGDTARINAKKL